MSLISALIGVTAATIALQPVPAGKDEGPEATAAHYYAPPNGTEAAPAFDSERLAKAGPITLARSIGLVEEELAQCKTMRLEMEALIGERHGSYSVHPDWVAGYQSCLQTRFAEINAIGKAIKTREQALLSGLDAETAVRTADAMARLTVYQMDVKHAVVKEVDNQKTFVKFYNYGNKLDEAPIDLEEREQPAAIELGGNR